MKKFLLGLLASILMTSAAMAEPKYTPAEAAQLLNQSVFGFGTIGSNHKFCTAAKIGPREYLTAAHCAFGLHTGWRLESSTGVYAFIRSATVATSIKGYKGFEDWAILHASADNEAPALSLGCGEPHYVGEPVAYMGFPEGLERAFGVGYVSTFKSTGRNNANVFVDLPAAPGASGSPVISLDTGLIMGVLTEGVLSSRTREFYMIGLEGIDAVDQCEDWNQRMKHLNDLDTGDNFYPALEDEETSEIVDAT